jgi:hypothetical protein
VPRHLPLNISGQLDSPGLYVWDNGHDGITITNITINIIHITINSTTSQQIF